MNPERFCKGALAEVDPLVERIIRQEATRQERKLVLIASESICPPPVREALASPFSNIYAEGYPGLRMTNDSPEGLEDFASHLAHYARLADRRYYRGCEYADLVEALAQRRVAALFANDRVPAEGIYANVQSLSGAAANNAVYEALVQPGGTVLGMALASGGHLTHGSPVNRSGKHYRIRSYTVTGDGQLDYEGMRELARTEQPELIIAGFSAYPWDLDWPQLRAIADEVGARLAADIAHTAGLVAGGVLSSPVGYADVVSFTTHKTLCGPRGAVILTTDRETARKVDSAVFPGEQGGPHINAIAAKAVAFELAAGEQFREMQRQVAANAQALAEGFREQGLPLAYGGTNSHMVLLDCSKLRTASGEATSGELVARILDAVGIVVNKNTIAGDESAVYPSGVRFGTTWVSQRGLGTAEMKELAGIVARTIQTISAFRYHGGIARGRIALEELEQRRREVAALVARACPVEPAAAPPEEYPFLLPGQDAETSSLLLVRGRQALSLLHCLCSTNVVGLAPEQGCVATLNEQAEQPLATAKMARLADDGDEQRVLLSVTHGDPAALQRWLRALSDGTLGLVGDLYRKAPGPVVVEALAADHELVRQASGTLDKAVEGPAGAKVFALATEAQPTQTATTSGFTFQPDQGEPRRTPLYDWHVAHTSKGQIANFAGWLLPVYFSGIREEHQAVREAAGLFDVSHMGVLEVTGRGAERYLDVVTTNAVSRLRPGRAQYSYLLAADGRVIDDILVYRRGQEQFMVVVNAANADEDEAWLRAVLAGEAELDLRRPGRRLELEAHLRNLKDPASGADQRVDTALQGPQALPLLCSLAATTELATQLKGLRPFEFAEGKLRDIPALISRTGYTGEPLGFEIYVHPDRMPSLWETLLAEGRSLGVVAAGLGARDTTRTEAGLPLHGHELAGEHQVNPFEAGYGGFVKLHKTWFVGREAMVEAHRNPKRRIVRFVVEESGGRMIRPGAPVVDGRRGKVVGTVTSCAKVGEEQVGLAIAPAKLDSPGTRLEIFPLPPRIPPAKSVDQLQLGDMVALPRPATVVERFRRPGE
jgi:glycine hydroxymethyltransferase